MKSAWSWKFPLVCLLMAASTAYGQTGSTASRPVEDKYFESKGVNIRYVEQGTGDPVILLHGYTNNIEGAWLQTNVLQNLAKKFRVIAFDARGHGKSGKPHDPAQYGPEMGLDAIRLLDHLSIRKAHVVGYSMGSHVVAQLVTTHSERFQTMSLGGASGRRNWSAADEKRAQEEAAEMDEGLVTSQILRLWPKDQPRPDMAQVRELSAKQLQGKDPKALAAVRRSNSSQVVTESQMAAVKVPTIGIVGTADPYIKDFQQLKAVIPQMKLVLIEGASHGNAARRPEFAAALEEFLLAHPVSRK